MLRLLFAILLLAALPAQAHKPSDSYLTLRIDGQHVSGQWDIALRDLDVAIGLDQNGDGQLTWNEVRTMHQAIATYALVHLDLGRCAVTTGEQLLDQHTDGTYTVLRFSAVCPEPLASMGYTLFADTDPQHKGLVRIEQDGQTSTAIFGPDNPRQALSHVSRLRQFADYVRHGTWHIWIGFDHILFLLSLLLPAVLARPRDAFVDVLKVVTAFTLAHSLTLTLATLQVVSLPSRWVESAIAASVALAALNNIVPLFRGRRPLAAFIFGLLHGFGFANVLSDLGLPQGALALSLAGFNVGVELGQLTIVAFFLPCAFLFKRHWHYQRLLTGGSGLIAATGAIWFVQRAFDVF